MVKEDIMMRSVSRSRFANFNDRRDQTRPVPRVKAIRVVRVQMPHVIICERTPSVLRLSARRVPASGAYLARTRPPGLLVSLDPAH
ncbi:hypothetical protein EVAR_58001_1 [Eumeta japonica]|uniref:Uncharacterized protein n=1 Tax=Eumeta variegata TaxID=151549 RepID=A0A4C1YCZ7_EUMVA|nr:hypothetical protein EVAR_58001_1 [Eumeta japonica]